MEFEEIKSLIASHYPDSIVGENQGANPMMLEIAPKFIELVCEFLHTHQKVYFDCLSCLTGIDNGPEAGTMEVVYSLYSIPFDLHLSLKVTLDRETPEIGTVTSIWRAADWHEREAFDLLGITFTNHPDLRRILLPSDWVGHPLRKDYEVQESYHGIKVKY